MLEKLKWMRPRVRRFMLPALRHPRGVTRGECSTCAKRTLFVAEGPWLRDQLLCVRCYSIPRWRALLVVLEEVAPDWRRLRMHECSPSGPMSERLARECADYVPTHYFPGVPGGTIHDGVRCEDLQAQTFADESFDLVVTSDVFEHLPDGRAAFREIARTLRPGGMHVFTVPWYSPAKTLVRARIGSGGELVHIEKPDYHDNPVDPKGSLVFTEWGRELPYWIAEWAGTPTTVFRLLDPKRGIDGAFREVFVSRKAG